VGFGVKGFEGCGVWGLGFLGFFGFSPDLEIVGACELLTLQGSPELSDRYDRHMCGFVSLSR
jgi:hypothetical protein